MSDKSSSISGFYRLSIPERVKKLRTFADLSDDDVAILEAYSALYADTADRMIENVVGSYAFPLGIVTNFQINGQDYLIPMAIEEPSVVAAASNAARIARKKGGFIASSTDPVMIGQIQVADIPNVKAAQKSFLDQKANLLKVANTQDPVL